VSAILPYPTGELELEVDIAAQSSGGRWDDGAWDEATWDQSGGEGDWLDLTCDISELELTSGASSSDGLCTKIAGTTGSLTLHGAQYDPWAGRWPANVLGPDLPVRILWRRPGDPEWAPVFAGLTDAWRYDAKTAAVTVPLVDRVAWLGNQKLIARDPVGAGDTIPDRIARILEAAGWAGDADLTDSVSPVSCVASTLEGAPWDQMAVAADTDLGIVWIDRAGAVAFRPLAQAGQSWTPGATGVTLTDGTGPGLCVLDYTRANPEVVRNLVSIAHTLGAPDSGSSPAQIARSDASIARYGTKDYQRQDLICDSDAWCATVAESILMGDAFPWAHPEGAELDIRADPRVADLLLGAEIADLIDARVSGVVHPCVIVGYHVAITRRSLTGTLILTDRTRYVAGRWDSAGWDIDKWGV
jgi:hypothetical protein